MPSCTNCNGSCKVKCVNCHAGMRTAFRGLPTQKRMAGPTPYVFYTGPCSTCNKSGQMTCTVCMGRGTV